MLREPHRRLPSKGWTKRAFAGNESGATAIEYALIAGIVSIAIVAGATDIGVKLGAVFKMISDEFAKF